MSVQILFAMQALSDCQNFAYNLNSGKCNLKSSESDGSPLTDLNRVVTGPKTCQAGKESIRSCKEAAFTSSF